VKTPLVTSTTIAAISPGPRTTVATETATPHLPWITSDLSDAAKHKRQT
jgi:hypothetical protein